MKTGALIAVVMLCACGADDAEPTPMEVDSPVLGEWHLSFDPGECADDTARTEADFRITPFEDGGLPLVVLVVDGEDIGNAGIWLDGTSGRVRYETAYDGDIIDVELSDDGAEAHAFVRYTHAHDCTVEVDASSVTRTRLGVD